MSLLGKIFGKDDVIKESVKGIYNGVDAAFFTDEEKSKYKLQLLKAYEPFKLIQRVLATSIAGVYLGIWMLSSLVFIVSLFFDPCVLNEVCKYAQIKSTARELATYNNDTLGVTFLAVTSLYFSGGMIEGALKAKR